MIRVIFYNPESDKNETGTLADYHEIKHSAFERGFDPKRFVILLQKFCYSKKEVRQFERLLSLTSEEIKKVT